MFDKNFERNMEIENKLQKLTDAEDVQGGIAWTTVTVSSKICLAALGGISAMQCPTLACSNRCGQ